MVCATGCGRQACPGCRIRIGVEVRRNLVERLIELKREHRHPGDCQMWTLTVDPSRYPDAEAAYDAIRKREVIRKLTKRMGWKLWVCVVEWHESGWPHWHLVVWEPVDRMYYGKARVQHVWGEGNVWYTGSNGRPAEAAYKYATKYLTKASEYPVPEWVLDRSHIRMVNASRAWGPVRRMVRDEPEDSGAVAAPSREEAEHNRSALAKCGKSVVVIREWVSSAGERCREYEFRADVPYRSLRKWCQGMTDRATEAVKVSMRHMRIRAGSAEWERLRPILIGCSVQ